MMRSSGTKNIFNNYKLLLILIVIVIGMGEVKGQGKNYATVTPSSGLRMYNMVAGLQVGGGSNTTDSNAGSISDNSNLTNEDNGTFATLSAKQFNLLLLGYEGEAWTQFKFPNPIAGKKTTYIRFDVPTTSGGLNVNILGLVGELTGLFKKGFVSIEVYSGANAAGNGTLLVDPQMDVTVVTDAAGKTYFAITPSSEYNSVRVKLRYKGNLLGLTLGDATINMKVYYSHNLEGEACAPSIFASTGEGESTGTNVTLTELVKNANYAIDNNINTASQLQAGVIGLLSTVSQTVILNGVSTADEYVKVSLSIPSSILTLDLLNNVTLQAYNGNVKVGTAVGISSLIDLDLLGLFSNDRIVPVFFKPGAPFDRIEISMNKLIAVGGNLLSGGLNIHEVQQTVAKQTFAGLTNGSLDICGNGISLAVTNPNPGFTYNWYRKMGTSTSGASKNLVGTTMTGTFSDTGINPGDYVYYVTAKKTGCAIESDLDSAKVTVNALPIVSLIATNPAKLCVDASLTFSTPVNTNPGIWTSSNESVATVNGQRIEGGMDKIFLIGVSAGTTNLIYTVTNALGCSKSTSIPVEVYALPTITFGTMPTICQEQLLALIPYSSTSAGVLEYSIALGSLPVTSYQSLPASPIPITIPGNISHGIHNGYLTIRNANGCINSYPISVNVNIKPAIPHIDIHSN